MADNASRRGAANLGMPLMIVAFIAIGGFLYWLNIQAKAEMAADLVEEVPEEVGADVSGGTLVTGGDIQMNPATYEGQTVRVEGLSVASSLGTQGFWLELPNGNPFLISMSEAVKAEGLAVVAGQSAVVVGMLHAMSDSVLNAWSTTGGISEGDRLAAEFATHFIESSAVVFRGGAGGGG